MKLDSQVVDKIIHKYYMALVNAGLCGRTVFDIKNRREFFPPPCSKKA